MDGNKKIFFLIYRSKNRSGMINEKMDEGKKNHYLSNPERLMS